MTSTRTPTLDLIAGRSIGKEAIGPCGPARTEFLDTVARPRPAEPVTEVDGRARPWTEATRR